MPCKRKYASKRAATSKKQISTATQLNFYPCSNDVLEETSTFECETKEAKVKTEEDSDDVTTNAACKAGVRKRAKKMTKDEEQCDTGSGITSQPSLGKSKKVDDSLDLQTFDAKKRWCDTSESVDAKSRVKTSRQVVQVRHTPSDRPQSTEVEPPSPTKALLVTESDETLDESCNSLPDFKQCVAEKVHCMSAKTENISLSGLPPILSSGKMYVGAHTSIAGGLYNAVLSTLDMNGRAFGLFLRSQRTWSSKPLDDEAVALFKKTLLESGISPWMVLPHGSYLMNAGSCDDELLAKSRDLLVDELQRCEKLGLPIYNFHPGSSKGDSSRSDCIKKIAETINYVHSRTSHVITVIENMSCQGNTVGGKFSELRQIIDAVTDKSRIGVCLDTCHAFAAGYDIKSQKGYEQMKSEFQQVIGRNFLKAVHLNDSKGDLGCHLDRHENIGKGKLGLETFRRIMNDQFFSDVPLILETPECDYKKEINSLYKLQE